MIWKNMIEALIFAAAKGVTYQTIKDAFSNEYNIAVIGKRNLSKFLFYLRSSNFKGLLHSDLIIHDLAGLVRKLVVNFSYFISIYVSIYFIFFIINKQSTK